MAADRLTRWKWAARWLAAIAVLIVLVRAVSPAAVADAFRRTDAALAVLGFGLALATQALVAGRLRVLCRGYGLRLSLWRLFRINLAALFYGMFVPAGNVTAAGVRYYRIAVPDQRFAEGAVVMLLDRLAATAALGAVGAVAWVVSGDGAAFGTGAVPASVMALVFVVAMAGIAVVLDPGAARFAGFFVERLPERIRDRLRGNAAAAPSWGTLAGAAVLSVAAHLVGVLAYQALAAGLGLDLSFATMAWVRSAAMLAAMLPIAIAGLGVRDAALLAVLGPLGVPGGLALAFSLSVFAWTTAAVGLTGGALEAVGLLTGAPRGSPEFPPRPPA